MNGKTESAYFLVTGDSMLRMIQEKPYLVFVDAASCPLLSQPPPLRKHSSSQFCQASSFGARKQNIDPKLVTYFIFSYFAIYNPYLCSLVGNIYIQVLCKFMQYHKVPYCSPWIKRWDRCLKHFNSVVNSAAYLQRKLYTTIGTSLFYANLR